MARKPVIAFLIKVFPVFLGLLLVWHVLGAAHAYHRFLGAVLNVSYPLVDAADIVSGVRADGSDIKLQLQMGRKKAGLTINGEDITSNAAMLLALFLASSSRRRFASWWRHFALAAGILVIVHAVTVVTVSQEAFMTHPGISQIHAYSNAARSAVSYYNVFYEQMGMYLLVLVLWFPYFLTGLLRQPPRTPDHT